MWNRHQKQTGSNEAPLAAPRRWGGAGGDNSSAPPPPPPPSHGGGGYGRDDRGAPGGYGGESRGGYGGESRGGHGGDSRGGYEDRSRGGYESRGPPGGGYDSRDSRGPPPGDRYGGSSGGAGSRFDDRGRPPPPPPPMPQGSAWGAPDPYSSNAPPPPPPSALDALNSGGERKRKSRWGNDKVEGGAMPTAITGGVEGKDLENYAAQLRLDEIARALRSGLVVPPDGSRSPSPPPTYDSHGRRTNTREVRYRKKLEDERMRLVERQIKSDPSFKPPAEYLMAKRQNSGRPTDKVYIPVKEFPEINFFGLLVGPRGNSLKTMERESGAKISIRGKGSVKEGKGRPGGPAEDENDELHCLITADTEEKVQRCVKLINSVIETAASVPEGQNDHKRNQLRELASLNGTLRDDENQICQNCGGIGHRKYDCPEQKNWTAGIICRVCGGAGHMARDCTQRRPGFGGPPGPPGFAPPGAAPDQARAQQFDSEYASLMAELGETSAAPPAAVAAGGGAPDANGQPAAPGAPWNAGPHGGHPVDANGEKIPPWRIPSNWHPPQPPPGNFNRGPPPQQHYGGQQQGYNSYPQANMGGGQYGGYPQQGPPGQQGGYGGPQQGGYPGQGYGR